MSDLDEKLEAALRQPGMVWMDTYDPMIEKMIIAIKQAFKDAGWLQITKAYPVNDNDILLLTGQEWHDRFRKIVTHDSRLTDLDDSEPRYVDLINSVMRYMDDAAKRASGVE
jgi:hypothetical protein